jgi:hypothetical protein
VSIAEHVVFRVSANVVDTRRVLLSSVPDYDGLRSAGLTELAANLESLEMAS